MNQINEINCPICKSENHTQFISTRAMMHKPNEERYYFNKCKNCKSVFLRNPVEEDEIKGYYTENYLPYRGAEAWDKFRAFVESHDNKLDKKRVKFISRLLKNKQTIRILDVGCGHPSFLNIVQQKMNADCTGIDFSGEGWKNEEYLSLDLIKSSFKDFKPSESFDVITMWHYLEHDYNLQQTAEKLYDLLNPGGKLVIEVPDYKSVTAKRQKEFWQGWHSPRHLTLFSAEGFRTLFSKHKWKIRKHLRYGTLDAFTLWWLGRMEKKGINWSKSMEKEFWPLVLLKVVSFPIFILEKAIPMGVQLLVIEKKE
jgi:2-polyprenyl-3-methyl-5-hydroxy-6-metoxy-1,4-benzoquinol methylase